VCLPNYLLRIRSGASLEENSETWRIIEFPLDDCSITTPFTSASEMHLALSFSVCRKTSKPVMFPVIYSSLCSNRKSPKSNFCFSLSLSICEGRIRIGIFMPHRAFTICYSDCVIHFYSNSFSPNSIHPTEPKKFLLQLLHRTTSA
jgi:hypothetical protein